ncbi:MAG TPA: YgiQ family radical SAM protein, partial [Desulfobacteria bacterium]|nr:YgiQ family radical SAM protein [Desulfobacteria bacterium]
MSSDRKTVSPNPPFIPTTPKEIADLEWHQLDVILVTGDAYVDSSHIGVSVIGRVLMNEGYRVGIIAQPDVRGGEDIKRLGAPKLFWGVTAGAVDSMVANYTASGKRRKQ